jgi:hypothetical protein
VPTDTVVALAGCVGIDPDYASLKAGRFEGSLVVVWIGEGNGSGDGRFLYVPDPDNPLTFRRNDAKAPGAIIRPGVMYTDGGSIPKIAQAFRGFSPWGYAPAYMIHDWLFVARHCLKDGSSDQRYRSLTGVTFPDSAKIIGEAIRTLVESRRVSRDDTAASFITAAVGTDNARRLWDEDGACARSTVSPDDLAIAEAVLPGSTGVRSLRAPRAAVADRARVVTRVSF